MSSPGIVHAVVVRDGGWYVAECVEIAVVTQDRTLDGVARSLRQAVALHLSGEEVSSPRLVIQFETSVADGG